MTPDQQASNALGYADGQTLPGMPERPRAKLATLLLWPLELIQSDCVLAYCEGFFQGREAAIKDARSTQ